MSRRYVYPGACHCRNLEVRLESDKTPVELGVRRDTCSFCTKHHAVYTSDPAGEVHLACREASLVERYRFGTRTAEFLLCKACGVFVVAAVPEPAVAVVNVNVLDACTAFLAHPISVLDVEGESVEQRLARRLARWTPVRSFFAVAVAVAVLAVAGAMGGCAPFQSANVRIVPRMDGRIDVDLMLTADRKPPSCELVGPEVRATIDGVAMKVSGRGTRYARQMISGVELPHLEGCNGAWFKIEGLAVTPPGTLTTLRIEDGPRRVEISARNVLADFRADLDRPEAAPGDTVAVRVSPDGDPPLPPGARMEISIYDRKTRVAVVSARELTLVGRAASFKVPALPPGRYRIAFQADDPPLPAVRCEGVSRCGFQRALAPDDTELTLTVR